MNPFLWILSRYFPKDEDWVDSYVANVTSDDLQPLEAYVDTTDDAVALGCEGYYKSTPIDPDTARCRATRWEKLKKWYAAQMHATHSSRSPQEMGNGTVVSWKENQRGTLDHFDLMYRLLRHTQSSNPQTPQSPMEVLTDTVVAALAALAALVAPAPFKKKVDPVDVVMHRRVHKKQRNPFVCSLVNEIKAKLGVPARTPANLLTVRHMAQTRCKEVNLRAIDTRRAVEMVIPLVFAPDDIDIEAAQLANSIAIRKQQARLAYENKSPLFRWVVGREVYATCMWSPSMAGTGNA